MHAHLLNASHDVSRRSWLASANPGAGDFPLQNLPFGVFREAGSPDSFRGGVAIGDQVLDLRALAGEGLLQGDAAAALQACTGDTLNGLLALGAPAWSALRRGLFDLLLDSAAGPVQQAVRRCLVPLSQIEHRLPTQPGDYTDFYTSIDHALNVGRLIFPERPLTPNFQWLPIAYHGRVSSMGVSGQRFHRPMGQSLPAGASAPVYGPCARLDYELELAIYIGPGNALGQPIGLGQAESHIFGIGLLNDWSARDHQFWEMAPLGPFLGKNFATTVSPWIVTLEALAPYRLPWSRPAEHPQPLPYLEAASNREHGAIDIQLQAWLSTAAQRQTGRSATCLSQTSFGHQYWSIGQMVTQHTVGGCNLQPGDVLGSGTVSGPAPGEAGAIIELTEGGRKPLDLGHGEKRTFLEDGDMISLTGWCEKPGYARIGFGQCRGEVLPAVGS
jgi:fumarylacetoacetase